MNKERYYHKLETIKESGNYPDPEGNRTQRFSDP